MASLGSDIAADFVMVNGLRSYEVSFEQTFAWPFHLSPEVIMLENRDRSDCCIPGGRKTCMIVASLVGLFM